MTRPPRRRGDAGITLVELMVTTMVTALIAILTTSLVIGVQRTNQETVQRQDQIDSARVGIEAMARTLRASVKPAQIAGMACAGADACPADAFEQGGPFHVQFHANIDNPNNSVGPRRVTYSVVTTGEHAGDLVETVQRPNSPIPTSAGYTYCTPGSSGCASRITTRVVARDVVRTGTPLLRYFDAEGVELEPSGTGSLSSAQLKALLAVELTITVQADGGSRPQPTTYIQRVMMPNSQAVIKAGGDS